MPAPMVRLSCGQFETSAPVDSDDVVLYFQCRLRPVRFSQFFHGIQRWIEFASAETDGIVNENYVMVGAVAEDSPQFIHDRRIV